MRLKSSHKVPTKKIFREQQTRSAIYTPRAILRIKRTTTRHHKSLVSFSADLLLACRSLTLTLSLSLSFVFFLSSFSISSLLDIRQWLVVLLSQQHCVDLLDIVSLVPRVATLFLHQFLLRSPTQLFQGKHGTIHFLLVVSSWMFLLLNLFNSFFLLHVASSSS